MPCIKPPTYIRQQIGSGFQKSSHLFWAICTCKGSFSKLWSVVWLRRFLTPMKKCWSKDISIGNIFNVQRFKSLERERGRVEKAIIFALNRMNSVPQCLASGPRFSKSDFLKTRIFTKAYLIEAAFSGPLQLRSKFRTRMHSKEHLDDKINRVDWFAWLNAKIFSLSKFFKFSLRTNQLNEVRKRNYHQWTVGKNGKIVKIRHWLSVFLWKSFVWISPQLSKVGRTKKFVN